MEGKLNIKTNKESLENQSESNPVDITRKKAIEASVKLLDAEDIAYIIYIDDKFDIEAQKEVYKARLIEFKNNGTYINSNAFSSIDWSCPNPRFESLIMELWDASQNKTKLLHEVCEHTKDNDNANIIPALEIKNCYGDRIKLMTPDEWIQDNFQIIKGLKNGKRALCLFDFEFQSGNTLLSGKNGAHLVKNVIEEQGCLEKIVCGIFSHKFTEDEEDDFREKYSAEYNIEEGYFYTISKNRFAKDPKIIGFSEGIKSLLLLPYVEQLKAESLTILNESNEKAGEAINKMSPKTFNQIIQKSSYKEGIWEVSTLFRLYGILSKVENLNMISKEETRKKFNESIKKIRNIDDIDTGYNSKVVNPQLINLRNSELYINGSIINNLHLPLKNGDVFKIGNKKFMLLVQPCNLALRSSGNRSSKYNNAFLVPIKLINKNKLNITKYEVYSPENNVEEILCACFSEFKTLPLTFLDLVVFNKEGISTINMTNKELINELIHSPWKKRYEEILNIFSIWENKIKTFLFIETSIESRLENINIKLKEFYSKGKLPKNESLPTEILDLKKERSTLKKHLINVKNSIYSIDYFKDFNLDKQLNYNTKNRSFTFDIKRIKHYKSPYSDDLLQNFMAYLSRNAFDHDFTK